VVAPTRRADKYEVERTCVLSGRHTVGRVKEVGGAEFECGGCFAHIRRDGGHDAATPSGDLDREVAEASNPNHSNAIARKGMLKGRKDGKTAREERRRLGGGDAVWDLVHKSCIRAETLGKPSVLAAAAGVHYRRTQVLIAADALPAFVA
jgi:hypothetical protein